MDYARSIQDLIEFTPKESLFRECFFTRPEAELEEKYREWYPQMEKYIREAFRPETMPRHLEEKEFFKDGYNITISKHPRYLPMIFHDHDFFEMLYVLCGSFTQEFEEESVTLEKGNLIMIAPNVKHRVNNFSDDGVVINILVRRSTFMDIFMNSVRDKTKLSFFFLSNLYARKGAKYVRYNTGEDVCIRNYILDMLEEQQFDDACSDRIMCSLLMIFFSQLVRRHSENMYVPEAYGKNQELEDNVLNYLLMNYSEATLSGLADHLHFSQAYCSKLIKKMTGHNFQSLLTGIRMQKGVDLLLHTPMTAAQISESLGYENPETFYRAFTRVYHISPGEYRRQSGVMNKKSQEN